MRLLKIAFAMLALISLERAARAAETCGDGVDQATANGFLDEGCDPYGVLGVCESPLDCNEAGRVAPLLGQLVYPLKPDISVNTPVGPSLAFQRTFLSQYSPGYFPGGISDHQDSLGYRMHHNYMASVTYISGSTPNRKFALHMPTGQDVLLTETTADAFNYNFTAQGSWHFKSVQQHKTLLNFSVAVLTGEVYHFTNANGLKLTEVRDSLGQELLITYNANGKVDKVEDETRYRWLKFEYFSTGTKLLQYVKLYHSPGGSPVLDLTVEFTYSSDKLSTVKLASTTHETWSYDGNGYPTSIVDGGSKTIADFLFSSAGKLQREHTEFGDVGYTYNDTGNCAAGETGVYFNRYETGTTCTVDTADYLCGGSNGTNGWKFRALRCLAVTTSNEDLVNTITAYDPAGTCASCRNVQDYDWDTTVYRVKGTKSADGIWTSASRDSNGMVTKRVENDNDSTASTEPAGSRVTFFTYGNSSFPGRLTERRIKSELEAGTCTAGDASACKQTLYTWSTDGKLASRQELGSTYNSSGTRIDYDYTTSYSYDAKGRLTQLTGPRGSIQDDIVYTYHSAGGLSGDYLNEVKQKISDTPTYLITTHNDYSVWGRPQRVTDPNSKSVCKTYHSEYGLPLTSRIVVNGSHSDCTSSGGNDETTSWTYDTARRVTKTTRPRLNCLANTYDANGRLSEVQEQDYVASVCQTTGDKTVYTYDAEGLRTKIEWKNDAGTVTRSQEYTYLADRRVDHVKNAADTSKYQDWAYDDDGVPAEVKWEDYATSDARTQWDVDNLDRTTALRRYTTGAANEAFAITPGVQLDRPTQVSDPAAHNIDLVWDDLNRKVKQVTPDGGTNYYVYDAAGNLTDMVLASGTADAKTTSYTHDNANRLTKENTGDATCAGATGDNVDEIRWVYDALGGESCPAGSNCANLSGRLAYAKVKIYCDAGQGDTHFDQLTFYSYTESGRVAEHTVKDDAATPRIGRVVYTYDKNGNVTRIDYPPDTSAGAVYVYGGVAYSDDDRVTSVKRDTTTTADTIKWFPFGPLETMTHQNTFLEADLREYKVRVDYARNNAYRTTSITAANTYSPAHKVFKIDFAEDARQRYTKRDFPTGYGSGSEKDMYFLYDDLNRTTCRTTATAGSCPASGGADQYESLTYDTSSDRTQLILNNSVISSTTYNYKYVSGTDKIDCLRIGDTSACNTNASEIDLAWDTRGNRLSDDDENYTGASDDARTYTYDGRNNLITVSSKFYFAASTLHNYTVTYAYDERNRRIFKSFLDTTNSKEAQWFFYYDQFDRLLEAKYTPDIGTSGTYSVFQWYWVGNTSFLYYQLDTVAQNTTTTRRYIYGDEQGRPHAAWSWPTSGDTARVWEIEAGLFGWDIPTVGATIYQPLRFPGQKYDADTEAVTLNGAAKRILRPGISDNQFRIHDAFTGTYLQLDPRVVRTWSAYSYADQNPVMSIDPHGLQTTEEWCDQLSLQFDDAEKECNETGPGSDACVSATNIANSMHEYDCGIVIEEQDPPVDDDFYDRWIRWKLGLPQWAGGAWNPVPDSTITINCDNAYFANTPRCRGVVDTNGLPLPAIPARVSGAGNTE